MDLAAIVKTHGTNKTGRAFSAFQAWYWLEKLFAAKPKCAFTPALDAAITSIPVISVSEEGQINSIGLDVILDLTGDLARLPPTTLAQHGIWFLDCVTAQPEIAGLRAIIGSEPVSRISLFQTRQDEDQPVLIACAALNTKFIAARNSLFMKEKAVPLLLREFERVRCLGHPQQISGQAFQSPIAPKLPDFLTYLTLLCKKMLARGLEVANSRLGRRPGMFFLKSIDGDFLSFDPKDAVSHELKGNTYQADPFLWQHDGALYCFFETYDYANGHGHISVGRFHGDELCEIRTALFADYHLSFPYVFEIGATLYMMPESCGSNRIEIWRCKKFPDQWTLNATALEGTLAADSILTMIEGQWWLFTNIAKDPFGDVNSELHLFKVDGPDLKTITPHRLNPVVLDSRTARNAGRIIERDGSYYRPSQDNSHGTYGYGVNIMRINRLTLDEYSETLVRHIKPDFEDGIIGCHHLDTKGGRVVMDVRKKLGGR